MIVFNDELDVGQIWFDTNWNDTANRTLVATLSNITTLGQLTAIAASDIVVYSTPDNPADPIVLDLGAPGISFSSLETGVSFDINGDGIRDRVAWTASSDGILAYDVNGSGTIDNGNEIFTPNFAGGNYANGLAALASLDSNGDGVINSADADFGKLLVWQDNNHNGVSDAGELSTLADEGITSIGLDATPTDATVDGQQLQVQGSFTYADGTTANYVEVALDTTFGTAPDTSVDATNNPKSVTTSAPDTSNLVTNTQTGTAGNDTLVAAAGNTLTGNSGNDTFVFKAVTTHCLAMATSARSRISRIIPITSISRLLLARTPSKDPRMERVWSMLTASAGSSMA